MSSEPNGTGAPMPADMAIRAIGVGKSYDIDGTPIDRLARVLLRRGRSERQFWALQDVSFELKRGDSLGIIGRNGSGKSTLLQIIAGTLTPTSGEVHVRGRIAALLELGSGFNPHFTGRENVYLAGSILGIQRREMDGRFDDIAGFADIGDFLDRPLSTYSSGMHARLAFAVASCVEPDVLILDEILSVGDAGFQQRCVGRLHRLLDAGVTLLFVSHAADAVKSICRSALFLAGGRVQYFGPAAQGVDRYLSHLRQNATKRALQRHPELASAAPEFEQQVAADLRHGTGHGQVVGVRLLTPEGRETDAFTLGEQVVVEVVIEAKVALRRLDVAIGIRDGAGVELFGTTARDARSRIPPLKRDHRATVRFQFRNTLRPGPHGVSVTLIRRPNRRGEGLVTLDHLDGCAAFESLADGKHTVRGKLLHRITASVTAGDAPTVPSAAAISAPMRSSNPVSAG